jgi:putative transposase
MIAFIDVHREAYGVEPISRVLPIAPSTYHAHVDMTPISSSSWN